MRVLICGVGKITRHLLRRLGENWQVTLVDKSEQRLSELFPKYQNIQRIIPGDASSPVVLDDLGVADFEYVLALTDNDKVNMAVVSHSRNRGVTFVLSLVNEQENQLQFRKMGAYTVLGSTLLAENIFHYLQDPRIKVTPLILGQAEIMEVDASQYFRMIGRSVSTVMDEKWRLVGILRQDRLIFPIPEDVIQPEDRLVILGHRGIFKPVCDLLECGHPHFPLAYGQGLVLALAPATPKDLIINETMHLAQNTRVGHVMVLCAADECNEVQEKLAVWSGSIDIRMKTIEGDFLTAVRELSGAGDCGLVVLGHFKPSFLKSLTKPALISFAYSLPCPLLLARHTQPYEKILVPFNGKPKAELALEVAIDVAKQLQAEVSVVVVEEPEFIRGPEGEHWVESVLDRARDIAHITKIDLNEITRRGNPVKEVVEAAADFNLMVIGSTSKEKALFAPHVGELLAQEAPCSVLIVMN